VFHVCHAEVTVDDEQPPDVVLLSADRRTRAPLRAQLLEEGFKVIATETWPAMRAHLRPGAKPGVAIVDLQGLPNPAEVLDGLQVLMKPDRVLVLTALGTVPPEEIARAGVSVLRRPASIEEVVAAARSALATVTDRRSGPG
jgi:DNA-binding response OmpR family regulator